jgi:hypothetical protein
VTWEVRVIRGQVPWLSKIEEFGIMLLLFENGVGMRE